MDTDWKGYSHVLEGLLHLLVQQNWKGKVRELWPDVTRVNLHTFRFDEPWHFFRWRNEEGAEQVVVPKWTQLLGRSESIGGRLFGRRLANFGAP